MRLLKRPLLLQFLLLTWLYGTTAGAQTEITLHEFTNGVDGALPIGGLISDGQGNYFGVTNGYSGTFGTVFELSPAAGGGWSFSTLYTFQGGQDGDAPVATLVMDKADNLYGATRTGGNGTSSYCNTGTGQFGCGTIFEISPDGSGGWQKTTLYQFQGIVGRQLKDGLFPSGPLVFDSAGNLYGTTANGGAYLAGYGGGTVFELSPGTGGWKEKILVSFNGGEVGQAGGADPESGVTFDSAGNLYGTTYNGGSNDSSCSPHGCGTAFELSPKSGGGWGVTPLLTFLGGVNGGYPYTPLLVDGSGNLYGSAEGGTGGGGIVFKLQPGSAGSDMTVLHVFHGSDGFRPEQLVFDASGNLYSTTANGGRLCAVWPSGCGDVFKLSPSSSGSWMETVLYRFTGGADGAFPNGPLIFDSLGNIYGVASEGGSYGFGTVFEIVP